MTDNKSENEIGEGGIQAILFDIKHFNTQQANNWLRRNNFKPIKRVHKTEQYLRYRIADPAGFKTFYTIDVTEGIRAIYGKK